MRTSEGEEKFIKELAELNNTANHIFIALERIATCLEKYSDKVLGPME